MGCQRLCDHHVQRGRFKTEVRLKLLVQSIEAKADQRGDVTGITARSGKAKIQELDLAIDSEQQKAKHARAGLSIRQVDAKPFKQPRRSDQHVLLAEDGFNKRDVRARAAPHARSFRCSTT